jgi:hypothetical protein
VDSYRAASDRHRRARLAAYDLVRRDAISNAGLGPELRLGDIDVGALAEWERSWASRKHARGVGGWNWPELVRALPHRAAVLPMAVWYGSDLCGLALGQASRSRAGGLRHTFTLTFVERRPEPPPVVLRGLITALAVDVAENYGRALGATRLVLRNPDPNLLSYYERQGFATVRKLQEPLYCFKEI